MAVSRGRSQDGTGTELDLPAPAPQAPGMQIQGGAGGTSALLTDLEVAEGVLSGLAEAVDLIASECDGLLRDLSTHVVKMRSGLLLRLWRPQTDPALARELDWVLLRIRTVGAAAEGSAADLASDVRAVGSRVEDLTCALRRARRTYAEAEGAAQSLFSLVLTARGLRTRAMNAQTPGLNLGSLFAMAEGGVLFGAASGLDRIGNAFDMDPGLRPAHAPLSDALIADLAQSILLTAPQGEVPFTPDQAVALLGIRLDQAQDLVIGPRTRAAAVTEYVPTGAGQRALVPAHNLREAIDAVEHLYSRHGTREGTIAIQRNTHPDGRITWAVLIPGTQGGWTEGHLFDWSSNFRLIANRPTVSTRAVELAMEEAGIRPGEDVALIGHSQGGLIGEALAAQDGIEEKFSITNIVTAGSPTAAQRAPAHIYHLHLEMVADIVPSADGAPNPDTPNRTTIVVDPEKLAPQDRANFDGPGNAHALSTYLAALALAERSAHPSAQEAIGRVNAVFPRKVHGSEVSGGVGPGAGGNPGRAEVRLFAAHEAHEVRDKPRERAEAAVERTVEPAGEPSGEPGVSAVVPPDPAQPGRRRTR